MKAKLTLEDVGGLQGISSYAFQSGSVSLVEGGNASGKTSLIKGLAGILSVPPDGFLSPFHLIEVKQLGLRSEERSAQEGFVNVHAARAKVKLEVNGTTHVYEIDRDGKVVTFPDIGDERFLLTGILSKSSRVLRQIREGADDFTWAVTKLSRAKTYEEILHVNETTKEDQAFQLRQTKERLEKIKRAMETKERLEKQLSKLEIKLESTRKRADKAKGELEKRDRLSNSIEELRDKIVQDEQRIEEMEQARRQAEEEVSEIERQIEELRADLVELQTRTDPQQIEERILEIKEDKALLVERRSVINAQLNLFVTAIAGLKIGVREKTDCPLCKDGKISRRDLEQQRERLRKEKDVVNGQIEELGLEELQLRRTKQESEEEQKRIKQEISGKQSLLSAKRESRGMKIAKGDIDTLEERRLELKAKEEQQRQLRAAGEQSKIIKEYEEMQIRRAEINSEIRRIDTLLRENTVLINGKRLSIAKAEEYYERSVSFLETTANLLRQRIEEHRRKAADAFNTSITVLLKRLRFSEFRTIKLNKEYRLYVERFRSDREEYELQQIQTLSGSEQIAVALVMQLALRETYFPESDFLILDDVLIEFDEERRVEVIRYLTSKAESEDWFIITTSTREDLDKLRVSVYQG